MKLCMVVRSFRRQIATFTTAHIAFETFRRGHEAVFMNYTDFSIDHAGAVRGLVHRPWVSRGASIEEYVAALQTARVDSERVYLAEFDIVFLRNNPIERETRLEERIGNPALDFGRRLKEMGVRVLNDPDGLVRANTKMYLSTLPDDIRPRTLISRDADEVKAFIRSLDRPAILKPLQGYGGEGVFYVRRGEAANLNQYISTLRREGYIIAQEYLPEAKQGDKRLLLLHGDPIRVNGRHAIYRRVRSKTGDIRNNIHAGGLPRRCDFTEAEERIANVLRSRLVQDGLYFVGVDIVGSKLLEINVFCPGGINNINLLYGVNVGEVMVSDLERMVESGLGSRRVAGRPNVPSP